jgi:threonine dehydratase
MQHITLQVRCASYTAALAAGEPVRPSNTSSTLADGLAVPVVGENAFKVARPLVDKVEEDVE